MIECSKAEWRLAAWVAAAMAAAMAGVGLCVAMALLAGALTHPLFGRRGWRGWAAALAGALLATGSGAGLAELATLRPDQFDLAATAVAMTLMTPMGVLWRALIALVHLLAAGAGVIRREGGLTPTLRCGAGVI